jgi:hypothetical protein
MSASGESRFGQEQGQGGNHHGAAPRSSRHAGRLGLALVLAAGLGALAFFLFRNGDEPAPPSQGGTATRSPATAASLDPTTPRQAPLEPDAPVDPAGPDERRPVEPAPAGTSLPQGVLGRVVDATGMPLPGATVLLVEHLASNPFESLLYADRGVVVPPLARTTTGPDGRFALGAQALSPNDYEVRALAPGFAETTLPKLRLFPARWIDLGDLPLERGLRLSGKVTVQGSDGFPVPGATIVARPVGLGPQTTPTPEREAGIVASGDGSGRYVLEGLRAGFVQVAAVAPGFARVLRPVVELKAGAENVCDFELPRGTSIIGLVVDDQGKAIAGARVEARSISTQLAGAGEARSGEDGRFEVIGLVEGAYVMSAVAPGYVRAELKPVRSGGREAKLTLAAQTALRARVVRPDGASPDRFDVLLLRWHEATDSLSDLPAAQIQRVFAAQLVEGVFAVGRVDPGGYVLQVEAEGFAKSFSEPFVVAAGESAREVPVTLRSGATLLVRVLRADGSPLAGATLAALPAFADENPLTSMLAKALPSRTTQAQCLSDAQGLARLEHLAPGVYQLGIRDAEHCDARLREIRLDDGSTRDLGNVTLERGAAVSGTVLVDGRPAGQVKVSLHSESPAGGDAAAMIFAEAVSDDRGEFTLPQRLPTGTYVARAARQNLATILLQVVDYQKTRQTLTIHPGQELVRLQFAIQSN